ncbi:MAG: cytochrome c biogenesis protein CcdA, partial [Anaerolineae bacterium]
YLPGLRDKYGAQIEIRIFEISENPDNYRIMLGLEKVYGITEEEAGVPLIFIGDRYLVGADAIRAELEPLIDGYLAQGGVDYPSLENLPDVSIPTPTPHVHFLAFYSQDCAECLPIKDEYLLGLSRKYGNQVKISAGDVGNPQNAQLLKALLAAYGVPPEQANQLPALFIGDQLLLGADEIRARLESLIEGYLTTGGVDLPNLELPLVNDTSVPTGPADPPIHMAYFSKAGCSVCARVNIYLDTVQRLYPQLIIAEFPIEEEKSKALSEWLGQHYGVPEEKRLSTPMVFVGEDYLVGRDEVTLENLRAVLDKYVSSGAEATWKDFDPEQSGRTIVERFRSFGTLTVVGAGLVDGLNPCAFATIVFFISYLTLLDRKGREILAVGAAFALGVFLTYLLVGLGMLKVLEELPFLTTLGRWVYGATALLCLILAVFTFLDYRKARRGEPQAMTLRIPLMLRKRINRVIREGAQARAFVPVAFATGFVVSIIELACTGQVYLPTIIFVMGVPEMQGKAFFYLLLYNLAFILPLVVVFGLAYFGTTSEQLGMFINRRTATIKLGTALLFLILAGWLLLTLL